MLAGRAYRYSVGLLPSIESPVGEIYLGGK